MNSEFTSTEFPIYLRKMTSPEIGEAVKTVKIALMAVGSIEQHGPHLPVDCDLATVEYLAEQSLLKARQQAGHPVALIVPALPFGITLEMDWPGHLHLTSSTHIAVLKDIGSQLVRTGFRYVVFLNGCVGNIGTVNVAVSDLKEAFPKSEFIAVGSVWAMPEGIVRNSGPGGMGHACELETSTELVIDPEHVHMERAVNEHIRHPSPLISYDFDKVQPFYWPMHFTDMTNSGVIGDPRAATVENGQLVLEANVQRIADILCHINGLAQAKAG
jgi:creatinine amidohydrolase